MNKTRVLRKLQYLIRAQQNATPKVEPKTDANKAGVTAKKSIDHFRNRRTKWRRKIKT